MLETVFSVLKASCTVTVYYLIYVYLASLTRIRPHKGMTLSHLWEQVQTAVVTYKAFNSGGFGYFFATMGGTAWLIGNMDLQEVLLTKADGSLIGLSAFVIGMMFGLYILISLIGLVFNVMYEETRASRIWSSWGIFLFAFYSEWPLFFTLFTLIAIGQMTYHHYRPAFISHSNKEIATA